MNLSGIAAALALLVVANGAPILARKALGDSWAAPIDGGLLAFDARPILGPHKTVRGLVAAVGCCALAAPLLGYSAGIGALFGLAAMAGDSAASFIKRRMGLECGRSVLGLDQIPEAVIPGLALSGPLGLGVRELVVLALGFFLLEILLSRIGYRLGIRRRPL